VIQILTPRIIKLNFPDLHAAPSPPSNVRPHRERCLRGRWRCDCVAKATIGSRWRPSGQGMQQRVGVGRRCPRGLSQCSAAHSGARTPQSHQKYWTKFSVN